MLLRDSVKEIETVYLQQDKFHKLKKILKYNIKRIAVIQKQKQNKQSWDVLLEKYNYLFFGARFFLCFILVHSNY